jgi:hypothetical protein
VCEEKKGRRETTPEERGGERERERGVPVLLREGFFSNWNNSSF